MNKFSGFPITDTDNTWIHEAFQHVYNKIDSNILKFGDKMPSMTVDGKYILSGNSDWTGSFWPGMLWCLFEKTGDHRFSDAARLLQKWLMKRINENPETLDHDSGFLYILEFVADYKLTGSGAAKDTAFRAAELLKSRYNKRGQFIRAWNDWPDDTPEFREEKKGKIIVDSMLNIPLLFWADRQDKNRDFYDIAVSHAKTVMKHIVRLDYSTFHTYNFNTTSGEPICGKTFQGYSDDSCWSRGQAWASYGFTLAYLYTGIKEFLETAMNVSEYFTNNLPADYVPVWDFALKNDKNAEKDTSAASIFACALLELSKAVEDENKSAGYLSLALNIMKSLFYHYSSRTDEEAEGILLHGCSFNKVNAKDNSLIYGDYFYVEALMKLLGRTTLFW